MEKEIRQGSLMTLPHWLIENIYWHGRNHTAGELVKLATGFGPRAAPYISCLQREIRELYDL